MLTSSWLHVQHEQAFLHRDVAYEQMEEISIALTASDGRRTKHRGLLSIQANSVTGIDLVQTHGPRQLFPRLVRPLRLSPYANMPRGCSGCPAW